MSNSISLSSIFEETKGKLAESLSGLTLPKDVKVVQHRITDYLNEVCDENNEFRQNLTQSEDYILQAALSMLHAQRDLVSAFDSTPKIEIKEASAESTDTNGSYNRYKILPDTISTTNSLIGAGGGALVGKLLLGGWGAVFGAMAGTAIAVYISMQNAPAKTEVKGLSAKPEVKITDTPLNVEGLMSVIGQICGSLDNLIETFRAQIRRVIDKYESQDKPTIEREYRVLLEGIQSLLGYKRGHNSSEEKYVSKLQERIEDIAELLDTYNLEAVDYSEDKAVWFDAVESKNATEIRMVVPAIIKNGNLVIKGKVFTPAK